MSVNYYALFAFAFLSGIIIFKTNKKYWFRLDQTTWDMFEYANRCFGLNNKVLLKKGYYYLNGNIYNKKDIPVNIYKMKRSKRVKLIKSINRKGIKALNQYDKEVAVILNKMNKEHFIKNNQIQ